MLKQSVTVNEAIVYLNELVELDRPAVAALLANRVPCNEALAHYPHCLVHVQHGGYWVEMLAVLNGLFSLGYGGTGGDPITFDFEDDPEGNFGRLVGFRQVEGVVSVPTDVDRAIRYLNQLIALDQTAIAALIDMRVPCDQALADHPTAQVSAKYGGFLIGPLGVLNGLFGIDDSGYGALMAYYDLDGDGLQILTDIKRTPLEKDRYEPLA